MCDTEVNHSIVLIYSISDLLPRLFSADTESLGGELLLLSSGQWSENVIYSNRGLQVLLLGFLQCGSLIWSGYQTVFLTVHIFLVVQ